jgi:hypothetical protein
MTWWRSILFGWGLFLLLYFFVGNSVFWENCNTKVVSDPDLKAAWHRYTCEFTDDATKERLESYCKRSTNTESTRYDYTCPVAGKTQLKCHICLCAWTWEDGKCQTDTPSSSQWVAPAWETVGWTPPAVGWTPPDTNTSWAPAENNQTSASCPSGINNSQGSCCKKPYYDVKLAGNRCCEWILLITNVPFIGQCIGTKTQWTNPSAWLLVDQDAAFPVLMWWLSRLLVSIILLVSFAGIIIAWVMIAASWSGASNWKKLIWNIITALALLGASGVILRLINPNFFW